MSWHCEDAALNYSVLPQVREEWHAIVERYRERYGIFDDWGMFAYTNGAHKPWGDYLVEIDVGIWEQRLDEETLGGVGGLQARDLRGDAQVRRLDHRLPRRHPGGRRRAGPGRDGQRVAGREARSSARSTPTTS